MLELAAYAGPAEFMGRSNFDRLAMCKVTSFGLELAISNWADY